MLVILSILLILSKKYTQKYSTCRNMSQKSATKNDDAWGKLFEKYRIVEAIEQRGAFTISSEQINAFREARLMTKFDHRSNLPALFQEHRLSILPITRGSYLISHFDVYHDIPSTPNIVRFGFPNYIESLDYDHITSEAAAIHCAYISGMLADFIGDNDVLPTVSGRMGSNAFGFDVKNMVTGGLMRVDVENSQIEIDGGYEGRRFLTLIEAKNAISEDFLIRQLYYPFRAWMEQVSKPVKTIFLIYSNGIFSLYEYEFIEPQQYNSLVLVKQQNYCVEQEDIEHQDLERALNGCSILPEPDVAFPQADSFKRVINVCELLYEHTELTREDITSNYDFDVRQTNYYTDAGRYLGLLEKSRNDGTIRYRLTHQGRGIFTLKYKARQLKFVECVLRHRIFNVCFRRYLKREKLPSKPEIIALMKTSNLYQVNAESTFERRASTVASWLDWIVDLTAQSKQLEMRL